ncbi:MAG: sodium:calcium antiporter [Sedimenticolaceae bacterium]
MIWVEFLLCLALIGVAGVNLSRYGDAIADKTGLGGTWIGVVMLASVTSLPELVTGVSSVTFAHAPEIAVGDVLGSCMFNLLLLFLLDMLNREESIFRRASRGHILSAGFGILLVGLAGLSILAASFGKSIALGHIGLYTPVILILYMVSMRAVFRYETEEVREFTEAKTDSYPALSLRDAILRYSLAALVILAAGVWLPFVAKALALEMGWHQSFVGTLFVAFATSVPEMVVTVAALRLGALDMAIGNLFGSNLFNIGILAIDDIMYMPGPLFDAVSSTHAISAFSAVMMTGVAIVGLLYRPRGLVFGFVGWAGVSLFLIYLLNTYLLFVYGGLLSVL